MEGQALRLVSRNGEEDRNAEREEVYDEEATNYIIERAVARQRAANNAVDAEGEKFNVKLNEAKCLNRGQVYESLLGIADKKHIDAAIEDLRDVRAKKQVDLESRAVSEGERLDSQKKEQISEEESTLTIREKIAAGIGITGVFVAPAVYGFYSGYIGEKIDRGDYSVPVMFGTFGFLVADVRFNIYDISPAKSCIEGFVVGGTLGNAIMLGAYCAGNLTKRIVG